MKKFMSHITYRAGMVILTVLMSSSLVYAVCDDHVCELKTSVTKSPVTPGAPALLRMVGDGAGITNQGIHTVDNGDIGPAATSMLAGFYPETPEKKLSVSDSERRIF
jgi:hypothetical protein